MSEIAEVTSRLSALVVAKAIAEPAFRAALLAEPAAAFEQMTGKPLPPGVSLKVVEATPSAYTIVLPYEPRAASDGELSDSDLEAVAGGSKADTQRFMRDASDAGDSFGALFDAMRASQAGGSSGG